jgi:hypothetical protein
VQRRGLLPHQEGEGEPEGDKQAAHGIHQKRELTPARNERLAVSCTPFTD